MLPPAALPLLQRACKLLGAAAASACLAACGGGEIGGTVSGLGAGLSLTLLNNGSDSLTVTRNGSFAFADLLDNSASYAVTVQTQPVGQSCSVANGSGRLDAEGTSIDSVRVTCRYSSSVRGTLSGLLPGAALTLGNGSARLVLTADGPFSFAEVLAEGTAYRVLVQTLPAGQNCSVQDGSGSFFASRFVDVLVTCD
jgi:hypothetical protein